ncbi:hypothetical protein FHL15_002839 [Xylaria flabelliformis]|uniref:Alcohol dehydrogenase-like N-terminal domain-containing protein n=1 Tax=Xylaria flabelliformis TaxID=2512241 RepID=A0A553I7D7_9PEZI|nr:hypothetical protein FHL15_002839 [Xylaria flabelliformis]
MKEALVSEGVRPYSYNGKQGAGAGQVVIKFIVSGSNPKDWKVPMWFDCIVNAGDDIAGVVHEAGKDVFEFKVGDRVAAFHEMMQPGGSYAEYAIELYATVLTTLLPQPWLPAMDPIPLVIYGAVSAVGAYAVQLAQRSNIHPLIYVAGRSIVHVETLIDRSKGDVILDYCEEDNATVGGLRRAAGSKPLLHALDAVSKPWSYINIFKALADSARITFVQDVEANQVPSHIEHSRTRVGSVHQDAKNFGYVYFRYFARGLQEGWLRPRPQEAVPGGLGGIQQALKNLKHGKANAVKYVFRIADTEGAN